MSIFGNVAGMGALQPDWTQTDEKRADFIRNKPDLSGVEDLEEVKTLARGALPRTGGTMEGTLSLGGNRLTDLSQPQEDADAATKAYVDSAASRREYLEAALPASGWTGEDGGPYTQSVFAAGITAQDRPHYGVVYSGSREEQLCQEEAFTLVDDLDTEENCLVFTCFEEKPAVDLTVQLEINRSGDGSSGGGSSGGSGADILDENGVIRTEHLPEGYPHGGYTEILPEQTLAFTEDTDYQAIIFQPIGLTEGETYEVVWNGTVYSSVAESLTIDDGITAVAVGDLGAMSGELTGSHPFIIMEVPPEMAEAAGGAHGAVMALDGSESAVVSIRGGGYVPIDPKWLPEGYPYVLEGGITVLEETVLAVDASTSQFTIPTTLNTHATYKMTWNGTEYVVAPKKLEYVGYIATVWGNGKYLEYDDSGEPFMIAVIDGIGMMCRVMDGSEAPTIEIETVKSYIPMYEGYLPTGGLRLVNGHASGSMRSTNAKEEDETYKLDTNALAIGVNAQADGPHAYALGENASASGWNAIAIGTNVTAGKDYSIVIGHKSNSPGRQNIIIGTGCTSGEIREGLNIFGRYNDPSSTKFFTVGGGTDDSNRSNAFTVDDDGNAWFAGSMEGTAMILTSPGGKRFRITVDDTGSLTAAEITE